MISRITLIGEYDKVLINKIKIKHVEIVSGISELYDELVVLGKCETYNKARAHYVAYTLALSNIDFKITETK